MNGDSFWGFIAKGESSENAFGIFTKAHIIWLLVLALLIAVYVFFYDRGSEKRRDNMRKSMALFLIFTEMFKQCVNSFNEVPYGLYLPLEICSLAQYTILFDALWPSSRVSKHLLAFAFMPAAFFALLMPSAHTYSAISFYAIHQLLMHAGIVAYIIALFKSGELRPQYRGIWISILIINITLIPIARINAIFNTNYMFIADPEDNPLLGFIYKAGGGSGGIPYIIGLEILVLIVMHIMYGIYILFGDNKWRK